MPSKKAKAKKEIQRPKTKGKKLPPWFDIEELRKKGIDAVAKEHGLKVDTIYRTLNKAGFSAKELGAVKKEDGGAGGAEPSTTGGLLHTIGLEEEVYKEFQSAKENFEGRAARALDDAAFAKVLLALYRLVSQ
ncbi:MAG: hypothetical protein QXO51_08585 [Halobacteria archaeon]